MAPAERERVRLGLVVAGAVLDELDRQRPQRGDLGRGGGLGDDDRRAARPAPTPPRRCPAPRCPAEAVTTGAAAPRARQRGERAADLERARRLQRLELQLHVVAERRRRDQRRRRQPRGDDRARPRRGPPRVRRGDRARPSCQRRRAAPPPTSATARRESRAFASQRKKPWIGAVVAAQRHRHAGRLERPRVGLALVAQDVVLRPSGRTRAAARRGRRPGAARRRAGGRRRRRDRGPSSASCSPR